MATAPRAWARRPPSAYHRCQLQAQPRSSHGFREDFQDKDEARQEDQAEQA
eukprot:CAMPEP_0197882292 /NCGR_PEP_ID=MMETSP1439-20131203/9494_1 /TAXON_ID=66791 /ORGANISM="Gonyaulax spinifera, Strain CCMP409" /LENGTH=50 /DNA_ID=CAMNT_0043501943 /DNA_START=12 /DNA_END=161 /DNA_ORIENTATION=+